jgi:type II secretory pathway component HofQ
MIALAVAGAAEALSQPRAGVTNDQVADLSAGRGIGPALATEPRGGAGVTRRYHHEHPN